MNPIIHDLPDLGPRVQQMLAKAGFHSVEEIKSLGAVETFVAIKRAGYKPSLNLLWAMEGLLSNRRWREVARCDRRALLAQLGMAAGKQKRDS